MNQCCHACKPPYFCGNKFCWCHAFRLDDSTLQGRTTYPDPTGDKAVRNLSRKNRRRNRRQRGPLTTNTRRSLKGYEKPISASHLTHCMNTQKKSSTVGLRCATHAS